VKASLKVKKGALQARFFVNDMAAGFLDRKLATSRAVTTNQ
jgi:hypothetical protein